MFDKIRPFQLALFGIFGAGALLGIFMFANFSGGSDSGAKAGPVLIWGTLPPSAIEAGLDEISANNDNYSEVAYEEHPAASFSRDLANALAAGTGPDLVILTQEDLVTEQDKLLVIPPTTVSERTFKDTYLPLYEIYWSPEGAFAIPFVLDPLVFYYNRGLVASVGAAKPPARWEEMAGLTSVLTQKSGDQITQSTIAFGEYSNVRNGRSILSMLLLQAGTPITMKTERGVESVLGAGDRSFGQTAAESAVNFFAQFADPAKTVYSWNRSLPESRQIFLAGDLAFYLGYGSELPFLLAANPNLDFDAAPMPQPGTSAVRTTYGKGYAFGIPKASLNPAGAAQVAFAFTAEAPLTAVAAELSMVPGRRTLVAKGTEDPFAAVMYREALTARGWLSPAPASTDAVFSAMMGNVTSGRMDASQALQAAGESLNALLP